MKTGSAGKKWLPAGLLLGGIAAALVLFFFDPVQTPIFPVCQFHRLTGLDCPGCGATRALHQVLHGNFPAALRLNAFVVLSLPLLAWLGARWLWGEFKGGPAMKFRAAWLWGYLAAYLAFGILRDLPVPVLAQFAP
jgi:hypothetical protein